MFIARIYRLFEIALLLAALAFLNVGCDGASKKPSTSELIKSTKQSVVDIADNVVPLTLKSQYTLNQQPIKSGVPFPAGLVMSTDQLRLISSDGKKEIQSQVNSLANWPDGSVKVALIQFMDNLTDSSRDYHLSYAKGKTHRKFTTSIKVIQHPEKLSVETGKIKLEIGMQTGLIDALWRDANNDRKYQANEKTLQHSELFMVNAFDHQEYISRKNTKTQITIEEQGPVRAVIRVNGTLRNANDQSLMKYQLRYYVYLNSDQINIDYSVIDDRLQKNVQKPGKNLAISATSYGLRLDYIGDKSQYRFGGAGKDVYSGVVNGEHYLFQNGEFLFDTIENNRGKRVGKDRGHRFSYSGVGTGDRAAGWLSVDSKKHHIIAMVRDFWQQYPNEMRINKSTLTIELHPARATKGEAETRFPVQSGYRYKRPKSFYFKRQGGAKTYQIQLLFPAADLKNKTIQDTNAQLNTHELNLMAMLQWYVDSGVFGNMNVGTDPDAGSGYDAYLMQDIYMRSSQGGPEAKNRNMTVFGWRDYGDRLRAGWALVKNDVRIPSFYNDTHVGANNFFKEFLRTGDQRWFALAEISTRHFMDIDVSHGPRRGKWKTSGNTQPAGEIHAIKHSMVDHESRNLHQGHSHVSGLSDYYLLTGDYRSKEVLREILDWWAFMSPYLFKMPFKFEDTFREAERDYAWPLYVMTEQSRVFGDATYHQNVTAQLVNYMIQWWQTPRQHIGYNPETKEYGIQGINDASKGTGYWTMTKMDNRGKVPKANGTNPWMAGPVLSNLITFYEQDKLYRASNQGAKVNYADLKDMMFQTMNYVVKYGYVTESGKLQGKFVYSETVRKYSGGHNHIVYPLAYLDKLYKFELAARKIEHPEWYETQKIWHEIALNAYQDYINRRVGENNQSYGFYGYEIVFPLDFFKLMEQ